MAAQPIALKALLRERHWQNYATFCAEYDKAARRVDPDLVRSYPSRAQLHRWLTGALRSLPYPDKCRVLEEMFPGWTAEQLFQQPASRPPREDGSPADRVEIITVFASQVEADQELRQHAATAAKLDILAVRALGLIALNDSLLRSALTNRETTVDVRVLLLDPDSPAAAIRATEIGESPESFAVGIRLALARLAEFSEHPCVSMRTAVYSSLPVWRMLIFDDTLYLSAFAAWSEGHRSGMYKLTAAADGVLHAGFLRQFDDMWRQARPGDGGRER